MVLKRGLIYSWRYWRSLPGPWSTFSDYGQSCKVAKETLILFVIMSCASFPRRIGSDSLICCSLDSPFIKRPRMRISIKIKPLNKEYNGDLVSPTKVVPRVPDNISACSWTRRKKNDGKSLRMQLRVLCIPSRIIFDPFFRLSQLQLTFSFSLGGNNTHLFWSRKRK